MIGKSTIAPYSVTWNNVPAGTYTLTAVAVDNTGAARTSANVVVTVTNSLLTGATMSFSPVLVTEVTPRIVI